MEIAERMERGAGSGAVETAPSPEQIEEDGSVRMQWGMHFDMNLGGGTTYNLEASVTAAVKAPDFAGLRVPT